MTRRSTLLAVLGVVILGTWAKPAFPQATAAEAQLNGVIRDQSGGAVANASITVRDVDTNSVYTTTSNADGLYTFAILPPGKYELTAEVRGFGKYTQTGIVLSVAQVATIDITLKVAQAGEKVVVTTETPVIEPTRTEISQVVDTQQINALPISGRLFTDFALLSPNVSVGHTSAQSPFTDPNVIRISFGGQRDLNNAVTVDGADNILTANGSQRATPSQEAVSEFRVVNNGFGAEYGRALGYRHEVRYKRAPWLGLRLLAEQRDQCPLPPYPSRLQYAAPKPVWRLSRRPHPERQDLLLCEL